MQITIGRGRRTRRYQLPHGTALQALHRSAPGEYLTLRNNLCAILRIPGF